MYMQKKLTLDTFVEYTVILAIAAVISLVGNTINTVTDGNPETFVSILEGVPGLLYYSALLWFPPP